MCDRCAIETRVCRLSAPISNRLIEVYVRRTRLRLHAIQLCVPDDVGREGAIDTAMPRQLEQSPEVTAAFVKYYVSNRRIEDHDCLKHEVDPSALVAERCCRRGRHINGLGVRTLRVLAVRAPAPCTELY